MQLVLTLHSALCSTSSNRRSLQPTRLFWGKQQIFEYSQKPEKALNSVIFLKSIMQEGAVDKGLNKCNKFDFLFGVFSLDFDCYQKIFCLPRKTLVGCKDLLVVATTTNSTSTGSNILAP